MPKKIFCYGLSLILAGMAAATVALAQPMAQPWAPMGHHGPGDGPTRRCPGSRLPGPLPGNQTDPNGTGRGGEPADRGPTPASRTALQTSAAAVDQGKYRRIPALAAGHGPTIALGPGSERHLEQHQAEATEMQDLQARQGAEEEALLNPVQQARYLIYQRKCCRKPGVSREVVRGKRRP